MLAATNALQRVDERKGVLQEINGVQELKVRGADLLEIARENDKSQGFVKQDPVIWSTPVISSFLDPARRPQFMTSVIPDEEDRSPTKIDEDDITDDRLVPGNQDMTADINCHQEGTMPEQRDRISPDRNQRAELERAKGMLGQQDQEPVMSGHQALFSLQERSVDMSNHQERTMDMSNHRDGTSQQERTMDMSNQQERVIDMSGQQEMADIMPEQLNMASDLRGHQEMKTEISRHHEEDMPENQNRTLDMHENRDVPAAMAGGQERAGDFPGPHDRVPDMNGHGGNELPGPQHNNSILPDTHSFLSLHNPLHNNARHLQFSSNRPHPYNLGANSGHLSQSFHQLPANISKPSPPFHQPPGSPFQAPGSPFQGPGSPFQTPGSPFQAPGSPFQPSSPIQQPPTSTVQLSTTFHQPPTSTTFHRPPTTRQQPAPPFHQPPAAGLHRPAQFNMPPTSLLQATFQRPPTSNIQQSPLFQHAPASSSLQPSARFHQPPTTILQTPSTFQAPPTTILQASSTFQQPPTTILQAPATFQQLYQTSNQPNLFQDYSGYDFNNYLPHSLSSLNQRYTSDYSTGPAISAALAKLEPIKQEFKQEYTDRGSFNNIVSSLTEGLKTEPEEHVYLDLKAGITIPPVYQNFPDSSYIRPQDPPSLFQCYQCNFSTPSADSLSVHMTSHIPGANFPPAVDPLNLTREKFGCTVCEHVATSNRSLNTHMKLHHPKEVKQRKQHIKPDLVRKHPCDMCDFRAVRGDHLSRHKRQKHSGVVYSCDLCPFSSHREYFLITHKRKDHKIEPEFHRPRQPAEPGVYKCNVCDYVVDNSLDLNKHRQSVHNDTRHKCEECEFTAKRLEHVKRHVKVKHEGIRYPCDMCEYAATRPSYLKKHKERVHKV